jgi:DNA invertase Pin-like site-specific DNA recombinase
MHQKNGLKMGGKLPYGYTEDKSRPGYIKKHPREQKVIKLICRLRKKGYPYNKIARKLQKHGITTGRKTPKKDKKRRVITDIDGNPVEYIESTWKHQQIKKILHREGLS